MARLLISATALALAGILGCADSTYVSAYQQRVITGATTDNVLNEASVILQREFGRVQVDHAAHRILTAPVEYVTDRESGTARDVYRGRSTMRRIATFTVARKGDSPVARLRIDVERQDTVRQTVMHPRGHRLSDAPGHETPIDRDAATTQQQNTVWTRVRRDTRLERALLEELRERLARQTAEPEPAEPAGQPAQTQRGD